MNKQAIRPGNINYFHLNGKIDPLSEIVNAGILTTGEVFWVKDVDDLDYATFSDRIGVQNMFTTIQDALDKCQTGRNDYVMVCPKASGAAWELTAGLTMTKDKVHLIGVGSGQGGDSDFGVLIQGFGTASTATTISHYGLLHVTGDGVEVAGINFSCTAGTGAGGTIGGAGSINSDAGGPLSIYGQNFNMHDCYLLRAGAFEVGTPSGLMVVGSAVHGGKIDNCRINFGTEATDGTTHGIDLRMNNERWSVTNTLFEKVVVQNDESAVKLSPGTALGMGQALYMENCTFINYNSGTTADEMVGGTAMSNSFGFMKDCASAHCLAAHDSDALVLISPASAGGTINNLLQDPGLGIPGTALVTTKT